MHHHIKTDVMSALGTFATSREAFAFSVQFNQHYASRGYTAKQMAGGARDYRCDCWMGEYNLSADREHSA